MRNDREQLITRKQEVLRELTRARRQLDGIRYNASPRQRSRRQQLETEVEQLMAEEYRLRVAIDRAR